LGASRQQSNGPHSDARPTLLFRVVPEWRALLPVHDATMAEFASILQRRAVDRPVVDNSELT
jgi:hypothetical protein